MRQAIKAVLISGLIFPGLGQISVGEKKRGWIIAGITLASFVLLINQALQRASEIVNKLMATNQVPDIEAISKMSEQATQFSNGPLLNTLLIMIFLCWIFGTIDAYRAGNKKDKLSQQDKML